MEGAAQTSQQSLTSVAAYRGEVPNMAGGRHGSSVAAHETKSLANTERLMEEICERKNLRSALKRVQSNNGQPGIDGQTVAQLSNYLRVHWPTVREQLLCGTYQPKPMKRVEVPNSEGEDVRSIGILCVLDRFIQQAMLQVLQPRWDLAFSDDHYGFRPRRSAHQAVAQTQRRIAAGYEYVVDIDLEKFFDRANHDTLMGRIAKQIADKRVLRLIRAFLNAGGLDNGRVGSPTGEDTLQGVHLSRLLSNVVLDDLERELERRGHHFARSADACNIYVRSERTGLRVKESITRFITMKLKIKLN